MCCTHISSILKCPLCYHLHLQVSFRIISSILRITLLTSSPSPSVICHSSFYDQYHPDPSSPSPSVIGPSGSYIEVPWKPIICLSSSQPRVPRPRIISISNLLDWSISSSDLASATDPIISISKCHLPHHSLLSATDPIILHPLQVLILPSQFYIPEFTLAILSISQVSSDYISSMTRKFSTLTHHPPPSQSDNLVPSGSILIHHLAPSSHSPNSIIAPSQFYIEEATPGPSSPSQIVI
ncbi:hypothetical protein RRG08_063166 [Elysia crispata]|uniref:Uncharacterized protein n=1 Tax=Elysia crispata TaxID=231223 RepID=A0AAE0XR69_9GAST|nr:hypothetical protein RRG08_063166 [Elysia crispata]